MILKKIICITVEEQYNSTDKNVDTHFKRFRT